MMRAIFWPSIVDANSLDEYKADYGKTLVTAYARINGQPVGIVANQRVQVRTKKEGIQMGGVIYSESADKAARFVMDCNQTSLPIIFFQDVSGFMVGRDAEAERNHSQRRETGERSEQFRRAEDHGDRWGIFRRRQLRNVRQGVRSTIHCRLAECALRGDGRGASVRHSVLDFGQGARAGRQESVP